MESKPKNKKTMLESLKLFLEKLIKHPIETMDLIKDLFSEEPKTLNEVAKLYSKVTDEIINKTVEDGYNYAGGKFKINYLDEGEFSVGIYLYFQDSKENWIQKENKDIITTDELTSESYEELKEKKEIVYDVEEPENKSGGDK